MSANISILDRVVERLKASPVGDLITEEDLFDIVKEAIPKVFMAERVIKGNGYHERDRTEPPLLFAVLKEVLSDKVKDAVKEWVVEHSDELMAKWKEVFDQSITEYVMKQQAEQARHHAREVLEVYTRRVNEDRQRQGLPPISMW